MNAEASLSTDEIGKTILEKIKTHAQDDVETITLDTPLADLGIHSLELTEIIFDVEDEFNIEVEMMYLGQSAQEHTSTLKYK